MNKKDKSLYFEKFVELSNTWLYKKEAEQEYNYLLSRISKDKIQQFNFGYMPNSPDLFQAFADEYGQLIKKNPIDILSELNLIYITEKYNKTNISLKHHPLLIPFYDVYGCVISVVGRTMLSQTEMKEQKISKYKHTAFDKRRHLYGLNYSYKNIVKKQHVVVVEGQFDFVSGFINGIDNIVGLGGSKLTFEHIALLKRFTDTFYMLLDNDEAGEKGFEKINKSSSKFNIKVKKISLPDEYKDLDDYLKINSANDIRELSL